MTCDVTQLQHQQLINNTK